jgi:hypothetical protein
VQSSASPGLPYHLLGRDPRYRWWRPPAEIVLVLVIGLPLFMIVIVAVGPFAHPEPGPGVLLIWANAWFAAFLPAVLAAVRMTGRRPGTLSGVVGRIRWRWLGACAGRGLVVSVAGLVVWLATTGGWRPEFWPGVATWGTAAGVAVVAVPLSVLGKQYLGGWLLQVFGAWTGRGPLAALLATAVVVAVAPPKTPVALLSVIVGLLVMAWLTIRTGGLEAAIGFFLVDRLLTTLVEQSQGIPAVGPSPPQSVLEQLAYWIPWLVVVLGYAWWTVRAAARKPPTPIPAAIQ